MVSSIGSYVLSSRHAREVSTERVCSSTWYPSGQRRAETVSDQSVFLGTEGDARSTWRQVWFRWARVRDGGVGVEISQFMLQYCASTYYNPWGRSVRGESGVVEGGWRWGGWVGGCEGGCYFGLFEQFYILQFAGTLGGLLLADVLTRQRLVSNGARDAFWYVCDLAIFTMDTFLLGSMAFLRRAEGLSNPAVEI
ncbi:hypothetical protein Tco_0719400 [Tanacetum coccineum]